MNNKDNYIKLFNDRIKLLNSTSAQNSVNNNLANPSPIVPTCLSSIKEIPEKELPKRYIGQKDFDPNLIITEPGKYIFVENIILSPIGVIDAILIKSDNVVLDLKNHSIITNDMGPVNGIEVDSGDDKLLNNIKIKNGKLEKFEINGIRLFRCQNITICNISIKEMAGFATIGMSIEDANNVKIKNCSIDGIIADMPFGIIASNSNILITYTSIQNI
jgi:hypothetical protein